jgi:hypothetical protein
MRFSCDPDQARLNLSLEEGGAAGKPPRLFGMVGRVLTSSRSGLPGC